MEERLTKTTKTIICAYLPRTGEHGRCESLVWTNCDSVFFYVACINWWGDVLHVGWLLFVESSVPKTYVHSQTVMSVLRRSVFSWPLCGWQGLAAIEGILCLRLPRVHREQQMKLRWKGRRCSFLYMLFFLLFVYLWAHIRAVVAIHYCIKFLSRQDFHFVWKCIYIQVRAHFS